MSINLAEVQPIAVSLPLATDIRQLNLADGEPAIVVGLLIATNLWLGSRVKGVI
ncbi:hypothetical protein AB4Y77_11015 [Paenarthrobacter sp. YAF11_1]|uniref:hypothetical protein n=1 Tax=Paenarthrobacter sp. YAF11_1 TaxID=3233074 RepID=UPI003F9CD13F